MESIWPGSHAKRAGELISEVLTHLHFSRRCRPCSGMLGSIQESATRKVDGLTSLRGMQLVSPRLVQFISRIENYWYCLKFVVASCCISMQ